MKKITFIIISILIASQAGAQGFHRPRKQGRMFRPCPVRVVRKAPVQKWKRLVKLPAISFGVPGFPGLFCCAGSFYRDFGGVFIPVAVPAGIFFTTHAFPVRKIFHRGLWYAVCSGNFFREVSGGYVSVAVPDGICLSNLPEEDLEQVPGEDEVFLFHDHFWKRKHQDGFILYEEFGQGPG